MLEYAEVVQIDFSTPSVRYVYLFRDEAVSTTFIAPAHVAVLPPGFSLKIPHSYGGYLRIATVQHYSVSVSPGERRPAQYDQKSQDDAQQLNG